MKSMHCPPIQAHSKYAKAKQTLDLCESSYQSSVTSIEDARKSWEKETEKSLVTFQSLEEDRLAHIRDSLWRVANISSLAAVADDLAAEEVRKTLEVSKLDDAIQGNVYFQLDHVKINLLGLQIILIKKYLATQGNRQF